MPEKFRERDDDEPVVPERPKEQTEDTEVARQEFLDRLRTLREGMERIVRAERPKSPREGEIFEGVSTETIKEREREGRESVAEKTWERIRAEGINQNTLREFLDNVEVFSSVELMAMVASIDNLLLEWDPALHGFLRSLQGELRAMMRLKESRRDQE